MSRAFSAAPVPTHLCTTPCLLGLLALLFLAAHASSGISMKLVVLLCVQNRSDFWHRRTFIMYHELTTNTSCLLILEQSHLC